MLHLEERHNNGIFHVFNNEKKMAEEEWLYWVLKCRLKLCVVLKDVTDTDTVADSRWKDRKPHWCMMHLLDHFWFIIKASGLTRKFSYLVWKLCLVSSDKHRCVAWFHTAHHSSCSFYGTSWCSLFTGGKEMDFKLPWVLFHYSSNWMICIQEQQLLKLQKI